MPSARSARAASRASRPGTWRACETAGGAHTTLRMSPPSWSVHTIGVAPAAVPAPRSDFVSARSCSREAMLALNRITPEAQPRRSTRRT